MPAKKKVVDVSDSAVIIEKKEASTKKPAKKVKKATKAVKVAQYNNFALDTCFEMARAMGVQMGYHEYTQALLEEKDVKKVAKGIIKKYDIAKKFSFEEDGYDEDLILVILERVLPTMEITASDFDSIAEDLKAVEEYKAGEDASADNEQYKKDFEIMKRMLMYSQRKGYKTVKELKKAVHADAKDAFKAFTKLAYDVLKNWTIADVKYYEGFVYSILSQFNDLYEDYEEKIIMDISDLYLLRGDLEKGKRDYQYVIRETKNKGKAYLRFATIYKDIDVEGAAEIVEASKRYVKEDSKYFEKLQNVIK